MSKPSIPERFWSKVDTTKECWLWTGERNPKGYGRFWWDYKRYPAHRIAYTFTYGPIESGNVVCHRCDNPPCVRPDHLFEGTQSENIRDSFEKGRKVSPFTTRPKMLTPEQRAEVLKRRNAGETGRSLGQEFGVSEQYICDIYKGRR